MPIVPGLQANKVSPGLCFPSTYQLLLNGVAENLVVSGLNSSTYFQFGPATPPIDAQSQPWIKTDALYKFLGIYTFTSGSWQPAAPPILPGTVTDFFGTSAAITVPFYECTGQVINGPIGGALTTPNLQGLVTLGAGTNPTTGTNFAFGSMGGEEKHTPVIAELAAHTHGPPGNASGYWTAEASGGSLTGGAGVAVETNTGSTGGGQPFNVLQSYFAMRKVIFWP